MQLSREFCGRMVKNIGLPTLASLLLMFVASKSHADVITFDVSFTANTFQIGSGVDAAPVDPVVGEFQVSLDPLVAVSNNTTDIVLKSLNITLGSALTYSYNPVVEGAFPAGTLRVGGFNSGSDVIIFNPSTNDFWLYITDFVNNPAFSQLGYTQTSVSNNNLFFTINQTGSVSVSVVPEPTSLLACSIGLAGLVLIRPRRRKQI